MERTFSLPMERSPKQRKASPSPEPVVSVLLTQCAQKDYLDEAETSSSSVGVGIVESRRVCAPLRDCVMRARLSEHMRLVHVRDWHDAVRDKAHLEQFGTHCIAGTAGAEFVFPCAAVDEPVVDAKGLNDCFETNLLSVLEQVGFRKETGRIALVGCWTEAKISFLLYELRTRGFNVAASSALCAGASFEQHFEALQRASRILNIPVFHGVFDLLSWLSFGRLADDAAGPAPELPEVRLLGQGAPALNAEELALVKRSFGECEAVQLTPLSGGFSGARVFRAAATDGQRELFPTLLKIGPRKNILSERVNSLLVATKQQ